MTRQRRALFHTGVLCLLTLSACASMKLTPAQQERNDALWTVARSCERGSLTIVRISPEGTLHTMTQNSGGSDWAVFGQCYNPKARPIWQTYCQQEPDSEPCRPRRSSK